jgi:hypothetical protein
VATVSSSPAALLIDHEVRCAPFGRLGPACGPDFHAELFGTRRSLELRGAGSIERAATTGCDCRSLIEEHEAGAVVAERNESFWARVSRTAGLPRDWIRNSRSATKPSCVLLCDCKNCARD